MNICNRFTFLVASNPVKKEVSHTVILPLTKQWVFYVVYSVNLGSGRVPWSSGYRWGLMFKSSWVQILAPYIGWTFGHFFTLICRTICIVCLKRQKKRPGLVHLKNLYGQTIPFLTIFGRFNSQYKWQHQLASSPNKSCWELWRDHPSFCCRHQRRHIHTDVDRQGRHSTLIVIIN